MLDDLKGRRVLLLQGPVGPFFKRLAEELEEQGGVVTKINFNAGDALFYAGKPALFFNDGFDKWPFFLEQVIREKQIEVACLFGDRRPIHLAALEVTRRLGVGVFVFEEGYLRPDYITLEREGVNALSPMPRDPSFYLKAQMKPRDDIEPIGDVFGLFAIYSALYAIAHTLTSWRFPHYQHHRNLDVFSEGAAWARSGWRRVEYAVKERKVLARLTAELSGKFYLVALQVCIDSQIGHTKYRCIEEFIEETVVSFAAHAELDTHLVFKHHPLDRGYRDYTRLLRSLAAQHGLLERIIYVHDLHLPTMLQHARAAVMMNSTVGLSALYHGTPVKLMGQAVFDLPGLTFQGSLDAFWRQPGKVDKALFRAFVGWMQHTNQQNGSFYKRLAHAANPTGLNWTRQDNRQ